MPRNLSKKTPSANLDISLANIAQLTRLPAERLRQHLSTRHLVTTGTKATMARRLYQAIHQPPITQIPTSDSTYLLRQQLSPPLSLPATQQSFALPPTMHTVAALQQPIALQSTQQPASLPSTQQPIASLAEPSTTSIQLPPRSVSMQLPVTSLTQQSAALLQPLPPPVSASSSGSPDLALLFDQFIRYATSTQAVPSGQTAPVALSPASIEDSIAVTSAHLQLPSFNSASRPTQPPTAAYQQLIPSGSSHQPITGSVPLSRSQLLSQSTLPVQPQQLQLPQLQQTQPSWLQPTPAVAQHSSSVLQPSMLQQVASQQCTTAAQHLPVPVPVELQQQIIRGEFIDFATLIHKTSFVEPAQTQNDTQHYKHKPPAITSFSLWMQAWNIYLSVMLTHNTARALELIGYQRIITSANQSLPLKAWLQYDGQFRTLAASNPHLRWDLRHPELWYEAMATANTQKDTKRWPCPYCGAKNHFPENCPRSPFRDSSQHHKPSIRRAPGPAICGDFNNGQCSRNICNFQHICLSCKGPHPRISCPDRRSSNQHQ